MARNKKAVDTKRKTARVISETVYLTPDDVVARWRNQISKRTLANWRVAKKKKIAFHKFGRRVLYPLSELMKWENKQQRK